MSAQLIADDILKLAKRRGVALTPMQLMKLVYISYGWYLAMQDMKLFDDRIEAWKYGPVIPDLYQATKRFGREAIPHDLIADSDLSRPDLETFLSGVVENYGKYSGIALSNLTHRDGTPWKQIFNPDFFDTEIPDELIREHYRQGLNARRAVATTA